MECGACLDVLVARKCVPLERVTEGKAQVEVIVNLLMGLLDRFGCRVAEDEASYRSTDEDE